MNNDDPNNPMHDQYGFTGGNGQASVQANVSFGNLSPSAAPLAIKDISTAEFMPEVIEASKQLPVIVNFWAPWCGPCKQLAPILERVVAEAKGAVKLVKLNIDEHPEIPGQMGVQSIPAVVAFRDGRPAEAFMGAKPESEVRKFVQKLTGESGPSELDMALEQAESLKAEGALDDAINLYGAILAQVPDSIRAIAGLGMIYLEKDDLEQAKAIAARLPDDNSSEPQAVSLLAAIELAEQAGDLGALEELVAAVESDPRNFQARFDLSIALNSKNRRQEAADQLLAIIKADRKWKDDGAKAQLLQFFEAWGNGDEATQEARRKLSSLLFS